MDGDQTPRARGGRLAAWAESPLFWLLLFGTMALVAIVVVGPKFSRRQSRLEANYQGREEVWKHKLSGEPIGSAGEPSEAPSTRPLPLVLTLGLPLAAVIYLAAFLLRRHGQRVQLR